MGCTILCSPTASGKPLPTYLAISRTCVRLNSPPARRHLADKLLQRAETDFFSGDPLRALSTLVYSDNIDLQRSASLTFAEITERGV